MDPVFVNGVVRDWQDKVIDLIEVFLKLDDQAVYYQYEAKHTDCKIAHILQSELVLAVTERMILQLNCSYRSECAEYDQNSEYDFNSIDDDALCHRLRIIGNLEDFDVKMASQQSSTSSMELISEDIAEVVII